jgi:hypothetical protein
VPLNGTLVVWVCFGKQETTLSADDRARFRFKCCTPAAYAHAVFREDEAVTTDDVDYSPASMGTSGALKVPARAGRFFG